MADRTLRFSPLAMAGFELFFLPWLRSRIDVRIRAPAAPPPEDRPVIFAANHVSWWDGFLVRALHRELRPRAPLFTIMAAPELRRRPALRVLGACALDGSTGGTLRLVRALERRRARDPSLCVSLFPQGAIWPSTRVPLGFARGIEVLARRLAPCVVVPVALHVEPLHRIRPTAFVHAGAPIADVDVTVGRVEAAVADELSAVHARLDSYGERALELVASSDHEASGRAHDAPARPERAVEARTYASRATS